MYVTLRAICLNPWGDVQGCLTVEFPDFFLCCPASPGHCSNPLLLLHPLLGFSLEPVSHWETIR